MNLNGYEVDETKWEQKSGNGKCNIGVKNGKKFFLKQITSYKFPINPTSMATKKILEEGNAWYNERIKIMNTLPGDGMGTLVKPIEYIRHGTFCYEVAHFIETDNMDVKEVHKLPREEKISIMLTVASCLSQLHKAGIIHGDLDPTNILISRSAGGRHVTKLIDFTDCFFQNNIPKSIMSKEQWQSPDMNIFTRFSEEDENPAKALISPKTDVFTLGLIFYTYCSKEGLLKNDKYPFELIAKGIDVVTDDSIDEDIKTLIKSMLVLEPDNRPDMSQVHKALLEMKNGKPGVIKKQREEVKEQPDVPRKPEKEETDIKVQRKPEERKEPKKILEQKARIEERRSEEKERLSHFLREKEKETENMTLSPGDGYSASGKKVKAVSFNTNNRSKVDVEFEDGSKKIYDLKFAIHLGYVRTESR